MTDPRRPEGGYRGALPPRYDALARPWVIAVIAIFLLIFVLAFAGLPGRFFTEPTPSPFPSASGSASFAPSAPGEPSASGEPSGSEESSASAESSASGEASGSEEPSASP